MLLHLLCTLAFSFVQRLTAWFLCLLLLLQTFSREVQVVDYQLHKQRITQLFCVNKNKPRLQCNGKCHLRKQLRQAAERESKAPAAGVAKVKYEVVFPLRGEITSPVYAPAPTLTFAPVARTLYAFSPVQGVFHPPAVLA